MELFTRELTPRVQYLASKFPFVTIIGPRKSGKSTLARMAFPDYKKVSLEDLDMRAFAQDDPRGFISTFPDRTIIDEVQRVPSLLSYLQTHCDNANREGMYILTGSHTNALKQSIDQSLAGRTGLATLLPMSYSELEKNSIERSDTNTQIFYGGYPRIYAKEIPPTDYYPAYIQTYLERDIRQLIDITNIDAFIKFLKLLAGRIGQLLNKASLAIEVGVTAPTIDAWLSVLESSYIIYLLRPFFNNFTKRQMKSPKLYFYDTGVACSLLELSSPTQLATFYLRGPLFENFVINQILKNHLNQGENPNLSFWRDSTGNEVDVVDCTGEQRSIYEIKSGQTPNKSFLANLIKWQKISGDLPGACSVLYDGEITMKASEGNITPWRDICKS